MVSIEDSQPPCSPSLFNSSSSISTSKIQRSQGRSMRTIRSTLFQNTGNPTGISENLTDSVIDFRLEELATAVDTNKSSHQSCSETLQFLDLSQAFSDYSGCSSDISGELQRLSCLPSAEDLRGDDSSLDQEPWLGFLQKGNFSSEVFDGISPENLQQAVDICLQGLQSPSTDIKRSAAAKLRFLAKNRSENRAVIGESGAVAALISLLRCSDPWTQEHAVTALFNLSLHEENKSVITDSGAIKPLVYVLKTGTEVSKQNAACALLSLALIEDNKISIGVCGAIPPLVSLIIQGSNRGKKDALTTLYKLCTVKQNKERAVSAGAVRPLVDLISAQGSGLFDKAMVVLSSLAGIKEGKSSIVDEGGISVLVDAIEEGSVKGKEFAVLTLLQLCSNSVRNRALLVSEGGIPPLVSLSQSGTTRAKNKAETLLKYLREPRPDASSSSSP
ncbi:hypothetical protein ACHQM5_002650 [Ranunculus cassubicifolius]